MQRIVVISVLVSISSTAAADSPPRLFLDAAGGLYLPGIENFDQNHEIGPAFVGEAGYFFQVNEYHRWAGMVGAGYTFHALDEEFLSQETETTLLHVYAGFRYVPMFMALPNGAPFFNLALGILNESADPEPGHNPPTNELTVLLTAGYFFVLNRNIRIGARIDAMYFEGDYDRTIAWLSPLVFAGVRL